MSKNTFLSVLCACALVLATLGCGDDDNTSPDADTGPPSIDTDAEGKSGMPCMPPCVDGETCVDSVCTISTSPPDQCDPACADGETCVNGVCTISAPPPDQCDPACADGETCVNGVCIISTPPPADCDPPCAPCETCDSGQCGPPYTTPPGGPCGNVETCGNGLCVPGCGECTCCPVDCGVGGDPEALEKCGLAPPVDENLVYGKACGSCAGWSLPVLAAAAACAAACIYPATAFACAWCIGSVAAGGGGAALGLDTVMNCVCCIEGCTGWSGSGSAATCTGCPGPGDPPDPCTSPTSAGMPGMACNATTGCCNQTNDAGVTLTCSGISASMALNPPADQTPDRCAYGSCTSTCQLPSDTFRCHPSNVTSFQICNMDPATGCSSWGLAASCVNGQDTCADHLKACATGECGQEPCTTGETMCSSEQVYKYHACEQLPAPIGCYLWSDAKDCNNSSSNQTCAENKLGCTGSP